MLCYQLAVYFSWFQGRSSSPREKNESKSTSSLAFFTVFSWENPNDSNPKTSLVFPQLKQLYLFPHANSLCLLYLSLIRSEQDTEAMSKAHAIEDLHSRLKNNVETIQQLNQQVRWKRLRVHISLTSQMLAI